MKLNFGFIRRGKLAGESVEFRADVAQKVKVERLAIEQMFDIHQNGWQIAFSQQFVARLESLVAVPFNSCEQQVIFDGQASDKRAIGFLSVQFA
jgi:hypothetical protein